MSKDPCFRRRKRTVWITMVLPVMVLALTACNGDTAMHCLSKYHDKSWAMLRFTNSCRSPINTVLCTKNTTAEFFQLFGGDKAKWTCLKRHARPGESAGSTLWSSEDSALLTHAVASSRYVIAACYAPKTPVFTDGSKFKCR